MVPGSMILQVTKAFHDAPYSGHFRTTKTRQKIERAYHWFGMRNSVAEYCVMCDPCQLTKTSKQRKRAPMQNFGEVSRPFQRTAMDIVGPLPTILEGRLYILVFSDHFTKFVKAITLKDQKTTTVAKQVVQKVVLRHGAPEQVLTDLGTDCRLHQGKERPHNDIPSVRKQCN